MKSGVRDLAGHDNLQQFKRFDGLKGKKASVPV
jgi:hypothetical protein